MDVPPFELYRDIVEGSADAYLLVDHAGQIHYVNSSTGRLTGLAPDEIVGRNILDFLHPDELETAMAAFSEVGAEWGTRPGDGSPARLRIRRADGTWLPVEAAAQDSGVTALPDRDDRGVVLRVRVAGGQDGLTRCLAALAASKPLVTAFSALASSLSYELPDIEETAIAFAWDGRRFLSTCSSQVDLSVIVTGYGTKLAERAVLDGQAHVVEAADLPMRARRKLAAAGVTTMWLRPVAVGGEVACLIVARQLPGPPWTTHHAVLDRAEAVVRLALERRHADQQLRDAAQNDHLTGLANRARFFTELDTVVDRPASKGYAVLYLDLDGFKPVNDTWGHPTGDWVLRQVAARVREACRPGDVVARLGGDEFAVICPVVASAEAAASIGRRVVAAMDRPFELGSVIGVAARAFDDMALAETVGVPTEVSIGASVGVVFVAGGRGVLTSDELIDLADAELYAVKRRGGGAVRVHAVPRDAR